jgi:hypothetical protein
MSAPNRKAQKKGWETIDRLFEDAKNVWVVHYSCEHFYVRPEERSARITAIAIRRLDNAQTILFSIRQMAERSGVAVPEIEQHYDRLEREMLNAFFEHVSSYRNTKYLHWNMRDHKFGFAALEDRFRILRGTPFIIPDHQKYGLARLLSDIYGDEYIEHPRFEKLLVKNNMTLMDFLSGEEEAKAFVDRNLVALEQSTQRKVNSIADIASRVHHRTLRTNTSKWKIHGGYIGTFTDWLTEHKGIQAFIALGGIASTVGAVLVIWNLIASPFIDN